MDRLPASLAALSLLATVSFAQANSRVAVGSGNWSTISWNGGTGLPGSTTNDYVIIRGSSQVTLNSNVNGPAGISDLVFGAADATPILNIEGGAVLTITGPIQGARVGTIANSHSTINMSGGTVSSGSLLLTGGVNNTLSSTTFNFSGGSFTTGATTVGFTATGATAGTFNIIGSAGTMAGTTLTVNLSGTMKFTLDATGISSLGYSGAATFASDSTLTIDGSAYTGGTGLFTLVNASSLVGSLDSINDSITGFGPGYSANLVWDTVNGDVLLNISAVPEPGTYVLLSLGAAVMFLALRRKNQTSAF